MPLAIPLIAGPGTLATTIIFAHQIDGLGAEAVTLVPVVLIACGLVGLGLRFAVRISDVLGPTVISVLTRIMAIVLAAVAIEMIAVGIFASIEARYPLDTAAS